MAIPKILVVDDEKEIRIAICDILSDEYETLEAKNGSEAFDVAKAKSPSLILMDIIMPFANGLDTCKVLRESPETKSIPIIMLSAAADRGNKIQAFQYGADDFIEKPFDADELCARVASKLRRAKERLVRGHQGIGNLRYEKDQSMFYLNDLRLDLTPVEAGILAILFKNPGKLVPRDNIVKSIWKDAQGADRLIDAHMTSLRKKIKKFSGSVSSIYGKGYLLEEQKAK